MSALPPLHLARGDPAAATPLPIAEAGIAAIRAGQTHYLDPLGDSALRAVIARRLAAEGLGDYDPCSEILIAPGSAPAIFTALLAHAAPGGTVLWPDPGWPAYGDMLVALRLHGRRYPLPGARAAADWLATLHTCITPETRVLIVNSPHNPTGAVLEATHWEALAALCTAHPRLVILSDEAYCDLVYPGARHLSPAALSTLRSRIIITRSFSKTYAMAGWRVGYLAAPVSLADPIRALLAAHGGGAAAMAQAAALWALTEGEPLVADFRRCCEVNRDYLAQALAQLPGWSCPPPAGTFYLFPRISIPDKSLAETLTQAGIFVYPGSLFGSAGAGHLRICFAATRETLVEFVRRVRET